MTNDEMIKHLHSRFLWVDEPRVLHSKMGISWDEEEVCLPLWNFSGQMVGYQKYRPNGDKKAYNAEGHGKYYTYVKDKIGVWGLESYYFDYGVLFITEGIFDACKFHLLGLPAIAVLANDPKKIRPWLSCLTKKKVAVCDRDAAGRKLAKSADSAIFVPEPWKDTGEMNLDELNFLLHREGYS